MRPLLGLLLVAVVLGPAQAAAAKAGALDRTFGQRGKVISPLRGGLGWHSAGALIAEGPDGELLVLRQANAPGGQTLVRYLPNGRLDPSFGSGGFSKVEMPGFDLAVGDLEVDSRGRAVLFATAFDRGTVVVEGEQTSGSYVPPLHRSLATVVRFNRNGALDRSFGGGKGIFMTDFGLARPTGPAVSGGAATIDSEDRPVFVAGTFELFSFCEGRGSTYEPVPRLTARLSADGQPDASFGGGDGMVPLEGVETISDIALAERGKLTLVGAADERCDDRSFVLLRLHQNGALDHSFGGNGQGRYRFGSPGQLAIDRLGRTYVQATGVVLYGPGGPQMTGKGIVRLAPGGALDRSFGRRGIAAVEVPANLTGERQLAFQSGVSLTAVDSAGRSLLTGTLTFRPKDRGPAKERLRRRFLVTRLGTSGRADRSFGRRGWVVTGFGRFSSASARDALLDRRGRLVMAGVVNRPELDPYGGVALVRYLLAR
jgi:uncharacterized delta-60 repeat protein